MNIREFEAWVNRKGLRIERRVKLKDNEMYVCEGYCRGDRDLFSPHYKTLFAISNGPEDITLGEFFVTEIIFPVVSKSDRLNEAEKRGREFYDDMVRVKECQTA